MSVEHFLEVENTFPAGWSKIVTSWGELNASYYKEAQDLPAWYVENSNSSLFAAAAWLSGSKAICEVDIEKKHFTGARGRPKNYDGRLDMEIQVDKQWYWVEAKRRAFSLSQTSAYSLRHAFLNRSLGDAVKNARQVRKAAVEQDIKMAALVFFSAHVDPDVPERSDGAASMKELAAREIVAAKSAIENRKIGGGSVACFAAFTRTDFNDLDEWREYQFPISFGVCAILDH